MMPAARVALCLVALLGVAASGRDGERPRVAACDPASPTSRQTWDACALLSDAEVREVQGETVIERKHAAQGSRSFRVVQCFYRTPTLVRSVSLALTVPLPGDATRAGPRAYWRESFHAKTRAVDGAGPPAAPSPGAARPPLPPRRLSGLGEEAFWVGDRLTGTLYALQGDLFIRVSVGGVTEEASRLQRTRTLAEKALRRLSVLDRS